jgi:hypothetical protein
MKLRRRFLRLTLSLALACAVGSPHATAASASSTDATTDLANALKKAHGVFILPPGTLKIQQLDIPAGLSVIGAKTGTVLVALPGGSYPCVTLGSGAKLSGVTILGMGMNRNGIEIHYGQDDVLQNVTVDDFGHFGVEADHATNLTVQGCAVSSCQRGINLDFCHDVTVTNNWVKNVRDHGIQFWGNWNWKTKDSSNLTFSHNWVGNGSGGGIWGSGASHVIMTENAVSNFGDVGLDLEWCDGSSINRNRVSHCRNAAISLFYSCMNVAITTNLIVQRAPPGVRRPDSGRWQGIWLTSVNRKVFPDDTGNDHVLIARNIIIQTGSSLPAIGLGSGSSNITQSANVIIPRPQRN